MHGKYRRNRCLGQFYWTITYMHSVLRSQTRNLYKMSKGALGIVTHRYGWKQNHGIASASALLMAAQVLNDAG